MQRALGKDISMLKFLGSLGPPAPDGYGTVFILFNNNNKYLSLL